LGFARRGIGARELQAGAGIEAVRAMVRVGVRVRVRVKDARLDC
jgi:hypothetical protein